MQKLISGQAVMIMAAAVFVTGCAATKDYTNKIFPQEHVSKDTQVYALKFLDLDGLNGDEKNWVSTDIITGRDTVNRTLALDKFSENYPATKDTLNNISVKENKLTPVPEVAKSRNPGEVRQKRSRE